MRESIFEKRNLITQSAILMTIKLITAFLAFFFHILIANELSIIEFGLFSLALTCLVFTTSFVKQGIEPAIVRYFSHYKLTKVQSLYSYILLYITINFVVISIVLFAFSNLLIDVILNTPELKDLLLVIIGLTGMQALLGINSSTLKSRQLPIFSMFFMGAITYLISIMLLLFRDIFTALQALEVLFYGALTAATLSLVITKLKLGLKYLPQISFKESGIQKVYRTSSTLFISSFSSLLTQQIAIFFIAKYTITEDVGVYNIALKISILMTYPLIVLNTITAPRYSKLYAESNFIDFKALAFSSSKLLFFIATLMFFIIVLFSKDIVTIFGNQYVTASNVLVILAIGQWVNLATGSVVSMLVMAGYEEIHRRNSVIIAIFTVIALYLTVPNYGVTGAAWITSLSITSLNVITLFYVNKLIYKK